MMKRRIPFLFALCLLMATVVYSQPSYYDLNFENDSVRTAFKSPTENYVFVRSKRGVDGVNQTAEADAIRNGTIQKIVLVFSEESPEDLENREEYNMERWDNLILTYPEFFQEKTKYKNVCQCTPDAGNDSFKEAQGFYIYYKTAEKPVVKEEKKAEPEQKAVAVEKKEEPQKPIKAAEVVVPAVAVTTGAVATISEEKPAKEPEKKSETAVNANENKVVDTPDTEEEEKTTTKPAVVAKKPSSNKPRRAKDPKACRPAFYGNGDEDLDAFFLNSFMLDKKQKKQAKKVEAELRIQLNVDGSVKRVMVICDNAEFKSMFEKTIMGMGNWNAAVRGGVTIRSEVRLKIKYDKESKGFKKYEMTVNPKPGPKCKMQTDEELFGS